MAAPVLSAGVVLSRLTPEGRRYLLLRAYNYWDFPKGVVEPGEEPLATALREVAEETSITAVTTPEPPMFRETEPYARNKIARYYLGETTQAEVELPINPALGRAEHHEYRWVSADEAHGLLVPRVDAILRWAQGCWADGD